MIEKSQRLLVLARVICGGVLVGAGGCESKRPVCLSHQYWSDVLRACVGVGEYMDAHGGSFPDGFVADDASGHEAGEDVSIDAAAPRCDGGQRLCGVRCADTESDILNCGACGRACPTSANATPVCVEGRCDLRCAEGTHRCGTECLFDTSTDSCGTRCAPCPIPAGAAPTCAMAVCGYACGSGFEDVGGACEMRTPRPLFPWGLSTVTMLRPTVQWESAAGLDGAQVEFCRDRACTATIERVDAVGTSARPAMDLPASTVIFWRLRGRVGALTGSQASATWQFRTPARSATSGDTAHGVALDLNGDGYSDLAVAAPGAGSVAVYYGSATGPSATPGAILRPLGGVAAGLASVGDVNGDGFGDLAVAEASSALFSVFAGSSTGVNSTALTRVTVAGVASSTSNVFALGDVNGDGYADIAASVFDADSEGLIANGIAFVFYGGRSLSAPAPVWTARGAQNAANLGRAIGGATDIDGDRLADLVIAQPGVGTAAGPRSGAIAVYRGRVTGIAMIASQTIDGAQGGARFGDSLSLLGSVDSDGFGDLAVGSPESVESAMSLAGRVTVFSGSSAGLETLAPTVIVGSPTGYRFGSVVRAAGDLNGDGFNDVAVGASMIGTAGAGGAGAVAVHLGSVTGTRAAPARVLEGAQSNEFFGSAIVSPGDCDGDGLADLVIGAKGASPGGLMSAGRATFWLGTAAGVGTMSTRSFNGAALNDGFGTHVAERAVWPPQRFNAIVSISRDAPRSSPTRAPSRCARD